MLEVHFNNEKLQSGVKDNSGMKFVVTQNLRSHDSGIMELGLVYTDKMAIPPGQNSFALHGYCLPQCSAVVSIHICTPKNFHDIYIKVSKYQKQFFLKLHYPKKQTK